MNFLQKLIQPAIYLTAAVIFIIIVRAWKSRSMPELYPWHTTSIGKELLVANDYEDIDTYLKDEDAYIRGLFAKVMDSAKGNYNRFNPESKAYPFLGEDNLNASFVYDPGKKNTKGVILLLHGLSDSPYHMRALGKIFKDQGLYVLGLRLPGHGTLPSGLLDIRWQDWVKATEWGANQVHKIAKDRGGLPLYMGGFSTGGSLVLNYTFKAVNNDKLHKPEKLFLFSPAIGVSKMALFAAWHKTLSWMKYFDKYSWLDILPEYDPTKYNSFTKNAGRQIYLLTKENKDLVKRISNDKRQNELPPMIAFQSLVDATVIPKDLLEMYQKIGSAKDELFVYDVNRVYKNFMQKGALKIDPRKINFQQENKPQLHMLINNVKFDSILGPNACGVYKRGNNEELIDVYPEHHEPWPKDFFAMSHVAVPISPLDKVYGNSATLGKMEIHGELDVLFMSSDDFMRIRFNPFFDLMEREVLDFLKN
jgi:alpha-beta hydrolase superfamily lysophospholipase